MVQLETSVWTIVEIFQPRGSISFLDDLSDTHAAELVIEVDSTDPELDNSRYDGCQFRGGMVSLNMWTKG